MQRIKRVIAATAAAAVMSTSAPAAPQPARPVPLRQKASDSVLASDIPNRLLVTYFIIQKHADLYTGRCTLSYQTMARGLRGKHEQPRFHIRTVQRHVRELRQRGAFDRELRYRVGARTLQERNRANGYQLNVVWPSLPPDEAELEAFALYMGVRWADAREPLVEDAPAATSSPPVMEIGTVATGPMETVSQAEEPPREPVVTSSSCATTATSAASAREPMPCMSPEVAAVLAELQKYPRLKSLANPAAAERLWECAQKHKKTLAQVTREIGAISTKTGGRRGAALEERLATYIEHARDITPEPVKKSAEERRAEKAVEEERRRRDDAEAAAARAQKLKASRALQAGESATPPLTTSRGPPDLLKAG